MKYEKPTIIINRIETKDDVAAEGLTVSNLIETGGWSNLVKVTNVNNY